MSEHGNENGSGLPRLGPDTKHIAGHPIIDTPKRVGRRVLVPLETDEGYAVAKISANNSVELRLAINEARANRKIKSEWPHGNVEGSLVTVIESPSTVTLPSQSGETQEYPLIITKYIRGGKNLHTYIEKKGRLGTYGVATKMYPAALAVDALSQAGLVHRDIKPGNIFMHHGVGLLSDLEFAVDVGYKEPKNTYSGTKHYIAPEQIQSKALNHRTNVWGFAATTYYAITGNDLMGWDHIKAPALYSEKETYDEYITRRLDEVPAYMRKVFAKAVAFNQGDRYNSCTEFLIDLDKAEKRRQEGPKHRGIHKDLPPAKMRPPQHRKPSFV